MGTFGDNVKRMREQKGWSQEELAIKAGYTSRSTISCIENGKRDSSQKQILAIANALGISPGELLANNVVSKPTSELADTLPSENIYKIPVYSTVSAGFGAYACDDIDEFIPIYISNPADVPNTIGIKVKGNSMYPKIEDGDIIIVRKQDSVDSGSVAVLLLDSEEGLVKKVEYGKDWIELHSFNPEYMTRRFDGEDVLRLRVVGLVIGSYKKF